jgi:hypothetical protein
MLTVVPAVSQETATVTAYVPLLMSKLAVAVTGTTESRNSCARGAGVAVTNVNEGGDRRVLLMEMDTLYTAEGTTMSTPTGALSRGMVGEDSVPEKDKVTQPSQGATKVYGVMAMGTNDNVASGRLSVVSV